MRVYIVTLKDDPTGDNALTSCGAPLTFRTREIGEDGRQHLLTRDKRDLYTVEPALLLTRKDQLKVKITAPEGVTVDVLTHLQRSQS